MFFRQKKSFGSPRITTITLMSVLFILSSCTGSPSSRTGAPACPESPPTLAAGSAPGSFLFYKGCGLWATDPDNPQAPGQVESDFLQGSLDRLANGTWDTVAEKIADRRLHAMIYAKDGIIYKVNAVKGAAPVPTQVSNESRAHQLCQVFVLPDYDNMNDSQYVYTVPGPDQDCGTSDDNYTKMIKFGMNASDTPIFLPRTGEVSPVIDLVDKNNGGILGWLAIKSRVQKRLPDRAFSVSDINTNMLSMPAGFGFFTGTQIQVSGDGLPGGLTPGIYFADPDDGKNPDLFKLKAQFKRIILKDGNTLDVELGPTLQRIAEIEAAIGNREVEKHEIIEEEIDITSSGSGTINGIAQYINLHRCDINLENCGAPIKETLFKTFCAEAGFDQVGTEENLLGQAFRVGAYDRFNNPLQGEGVDWTRVDDPTYDDEDKTTTNADGKVFFTGRMGDNDETAGWNVFRARVAGIGFPLQFSARKPSDPVGEATAPSCKTKEEFYMLNVQALGYGNLFRGQMVIRIDVRFKPQPGDEEKERANRTGSKGLLFTYDIASGTLSPTEKYTSVEFFSDGGAAAFPDGTPFNADRSHLFFADRGTLYKLPLDGSANETQLVSEARQFIEIEPVSDHVVYSLIDLAPAQPISNLKSVSKSGGVPNTLHGDTTHFFLPIATDRDWDRVYFQTLGPDPNDPGILSKIFVVREDGSDRKETKDATMAGRTASRIISIVNCQPQIFSCEGGTLVATMGSDPNNQISLGTIPPDITAMFFEGFGEQVLGEGEPGESGNNRDMFYIKGDEAGSLQRVVATSGTNESFP